MNDSLSLTNISLHCENGLTTQAAIFTTVCPFNVDLLTSLPIRNGYQITMLIRKIPPSGESRLGFDPGIGPAPVLPLVTQLHLEISNMVPGAQSCVMTLLFTTCVNLNLFGCGLYGHDPLPGAGPPEKHRRLFICCCFYSRKLYTCTCSERQIQKPFSSVIKTSLLENPLIK